MPVPIPSKKGRALIRLMALSAASLTVPTISKPALAELQRASAENTAHGTLKVVVSGLRNTKGKVLISLYSGPRGFPSDRSAVTRSVTVSDFPGGRAAASFDDLPYGEYAVAILHDEDSNGDMTYRLKVLPKEGYGFSNNVKPKLKAPSFESAKVTLGAAMKSLHIEPIY